MNRRRFILACAATLAIAGWTASNPAAAQTTARTEAAAKFIQSLGERAIDVQVTRLRRKLEPDPREPRFLQTVRHRGYVLRPGGA